MKKDEIFKEINDNKFLLVGGSLFFFIMYLPTITLFYSDISCPFIDGVCVISGIIPLVKTIFVYFLIFAFWYIITSKLVLPFLDKFEHTKWEREDSVPKEYGPEIDQTTVILIYVLSFLIPFAGFLVGASYVSKKEEHYKYIGKICLILTLFNIILSSILMFIAIDVLTQT